VLVLLWCGALQYVGAATRGVTTGVDGTWLVHRAGDIGRAAGAVAMMAVLAFAIGAVTRRTAGAIAVLFGLLVAMGPLHARGWPRAIGRVVPVNAIWAIAHGRLEQHSEAFLGLHMARAVVTGAAWVIGLTVLGTMWFARREIR
jgi:hypothetical protein